MPSALELGRPRLPRTETVHSHTGLPYVCVMIHPHKLTVCMSQMVTLRLRAVEGITPDFGVSEERH